MTLTWWPWRARCHSYLNRVLIFGGAGRNRRTVLLLDSELRFLSLTFISRTLVSKSNPTCEDKCDWRIAWPIKCNSFLALKPCMYFFSLIIPSQLLKTAVCEDFRFGILFSLKAFFMETLWAQIGQFWETFFFKKKRFRPSKPPCLKIVLVFMTS